MNCYSFFRSFKDEKVEELDEGIKVASLSVHYHEVRQMSFDVGTRIPAHRHEKDVVTLVLEGHLEMTVGSETKTVGPGEIFLVPANTDHRGRVLGNRGAMAYSFSQSLGYPMTRPVVTGYPPLYRYFPLDACKNDLLDRIIDVVNNHRLYVPRPREFNDPFDCIVKLENDDQSRQEGIQRRINTHAGVLSFCEDKDNILLWAHYSNKHYGICLEFNMNQWKGMPVYMARVEYTMERPLISQIDLSNATASSLPGSSFGHGSTVWEPNLLRKMAFVKHEDWEYEKEWRIICSFINPSERYLKFPRKNVLTGIIFGLRTSDSDRQRIMEAIEASDPRIKIHEAKEDKSKFKVEIVPLEE